MRKMLALGGILLLLQSCGGDGGVARSFTDNGDGTITDETRGLVWEKKTSDGGAQDRDQLLRRDQLAGYLAGLNATPCPGESCDWRIPGIEDLRDLVDAGRRDPAIFDAFDDVGCTTDDDRKRCIYWSESSRRGSTPTPAPLDPGVTPTRVPTPPIVTLGVDFFDGSTVEIPVTGPQAQEAQRVRALRSQHFMLSQDRLTITDRRTGLMWEVKSDDRGLHDKDNRYPLRPESSSDVLASDFIVQVNAERYAGFDDWRLPTREELETIVSEIRRNPAVDSAFQHGCTANCRSGECSCTASDYHWTSNFAADYDASDPNKRLAFAVVFFEAGGVTAEYPVTKRYAVRAVRGG